jgi:[protein-PII] uridylyltransferase
MSMEALVDLAHSNPVAFRKVPYGECVSVLRAHIEVERGKIRQRHAAGESGSNVLRNLTALCDSVVKAAVHFGLARSRNANILMRRVAICALGGYGRAEMSPCSDLDISLLFDTALDQEIETLNNYLMPFFWDIGFHAGYTLHSVTEAAALAADDARVFTTYAQARLLIGDNMTLGRLKLLLYDINDRTRAQVLLDVRRRERAEDLPLEHRDLYALEPDIKENAGGLRDFHAGLWMVILAHGQMSLDDMLRLGHISPQEHLDLLDGLDFLWRIRNEQHFHTGRPEDRLTFAMQKHMAGVFGYGVGTNQEVGRFMEDYYAAATKVRGFIQIAARICDQPSMAALFDQRQPGRSHLSVYHGQLCVDPSDKNWFVENPTRLMEIFWESARRTVPLSAAAAHWVTNSLHLVNDEFRTSDVVRRYFIAICNRPLQAGSALREVARTGLLGAYLPEYGAIQGILRYEDFHSYPVDEHTLRALEALGQIPRLKGDVGKMLYRTMERIRDPQVLILSVLLHDLGKAAGEIHAAESTRLTNQLCERIGMSDYDTKRIAYLVENHMAMSNIAFYRDTDDLEIVSAFAQSVKTDDQLRMLLLLTFADLSAVGPNVWNDWKGALLLKLFLKSERILTGRVDEPIEDFWNLPKALKIRESAPGRTDAQIEDYLKMLGERYLIAYSPDQIAVHMECLEEARASGLSLRCIGNSQTGTSEVTVCTRDRHGLFAEIAGTFTSQLISVQGAALFTRADGWVVDCFTVEDAANRRPLTDSEFALVKTVLRRVVMDGEDISSLVHRSRTRLFALQASAVPVRSVVEIDNFASRFDTVIDIVTGDRTGLLYDIASALSGMGIDFEAAHIMTDVGRVRDSFYVRMNGNKIEDNNLCEVLRQRVSDAIQPLSGLDK